MKIFTTICCAALIMCGAIYAQTPADHMKVHFNTPVMVGETQLPAGDCDIQVMHGSSDSIVLVLRSQGGTAAAVASHLSESGTDADGNASVVLNRRANGLQVYRILFGDHTGYQLNSAE
jgi:hypothetical protein